VTEGHGSSNAYANYRLVVLIVAYVLAFIDRQVLNLLVEPLKRDLHLSDLQVSLLQGFSFALFLSLGGLPIGRLVDTRRRTSLLALGVAAWSLMTALCGLSRGFGQFLICRIGVGVGEATMTPSAYSLIGDSFDGRRLGRAMGCYAIGPYLGSGLALTIGALLVQALPPVLELPVLGQIHGWQAIFLALGPVGLIVALWVASLHEPPRRGAGSEVSPSWSVAFGYFRRNARALIGVNLAVTFAAMAMYSLSAWAPSFLVRSHHLTTAAAGHALGWRVLVFGAAGALCAGFVGDFLRRGNWPFGRLAVLIAAAGCATPLAAAVMLSPSRTLSLALIGPLLSCLTMAIASGPAILQEVTPNRLRGLQHAVAVLAVNLLGLGLGPTLVAAVTDLGLHDEAKLNLALAITLPAMLGLSVAIGLGALAPYARALRADSEAAANQDALRAAQQAFEPAQ
jgi:MFS family permease